MSLLFEECKPQLLTLQVELESLNKKDNSNNKYFKYKLGHLIHMYMYMYDN